jgi:hypothetical protein
MDFKAGWQSTNSKFSSVELSCIPFIVKLYSINMIIKIMMINMEV